MITLVAAGEVVEEIKTGKQMGKKCRQMVKWFR